jgi:hypothetical protein
MLSGRTVKELAAERESLVQQRQVLDERLSAIALILDGSTVPAAKRRATRRTRNTIQTNSGGLRHVLRQILAKEPASPAEAIQAVINSGFQVQGKTGIETRVYNELARMRKEGFVRKRAGRYRLHEAA